MMVDAFRPVDLPRLGRLLLLTGVVAAMVSCQAGHAADSAPSLVVVVTVDQLKPSLVDHYDEVFTEGLRTLIDDGVWFPAVHDHAGTSTGPGHATLATGVHPSRHGVVGNSWRELREGEWASVSVVVDDDLAIPGADDRPGRSPHHLVRDGFADWLVAADPSARVVSVAGKDRAAILSAGQAQGDVYWFETQTGQFETSTYYTDRPADWVERFNREALPALFNNGCWEASVPADIAHLSRPDTVPFEKDGVRTHFPLCFDEDHHRDEAQWFSRTPFLDDAVGALAQEAVRELELGRRQSTDLLLVGLSATDRIGHRWGPWSRQQFDNMLRLDRTLGNLIGVLDQTVGRGNYLIAISSDHGASALPEHLQTAGVAGQRVQERLSQALAGLEASTTGGSDGRALAVAELEDQDYIEQVITYEAVTSTEPADSFTVLYRNSYYPGRRSARMARYGFEVRLAEGSMAREEGTGHGTPYLHDRQVPLGFFGNGAERLVPTDRWSRTVDLAPTLAALAGVQIPPDLDGRSLVGD
jgi:predicted AlkP superfamily pyrophosphatase or phosphodiesterase